VRGSPHLRFLHPGRLYPDAVKPLGACPPWRACGDSFSRSLLFNHLTVICTRSILHSSHSLQMT